MYNFTIWQIPWQYKCGDVKLRTEFLLNVSPFICELLMIIYSEVGPGKKRNHGDVFNKNCHIENKPYFMII